MGLVYFLFRYLTKLYVFNNQLLDLFIYKLQKAALR